MKYTIHTLIIRGTVMTTKEYYARVYTDNYNKTSKTFASYAEALQAAKRMVSP
jgi:hypothetical protein